MCLFQIASYLSFMCNYEHIDSYWN